MENIHKLIKACNNNNSVTIYLKDGSVYDNCKVVGNEIIMGEPNKQSYTILLRKNGNKVRIAVEKIDKID